MAYNSAYTGSQVDAAVGAVRQKETKWDNKQDELTGTEDQIVGFNSAGEAVAVAKPDPLPTGGETGQVLTKTAEGTAWDDIPSDLPAGGTDGQILTKTAEGVAWEDAPESGVTSFKGRTGAVTPQEGDYTADMVGARPDTWTPSAADVGAVPTSRTVNGQELSQDISLTADNVGARPSTWTPTASDVGAIPNPSGGATGQILEKTATGTQWADKPTLASLGGVPTSRTVNGKALSSNISLTAYDVGARANTWTPTASEVGAVPTSRTVNGKALSSNITLDADDVGALDQTSADARYLQLSGGTMTGALALPGNPTSDNQAANKAYVDSLKPDRKTATLSASGWSGNSQTITVNGVSTDTSSQDIDISCADKASADAWAAGGVWCSNPTRANRLTFTCTTPPTANINLNIRLWGWDR